MDPFVAEIRVVPFNFAAKGWAFCDGQILPISQNTALFSLLGTFYGGDGKSNFALPNLQGCVPINQGQGPGLSDHFIGESSGSPTVTLLTSEIPVHRHGVMASTAQDQSSPANNGLGQGQLIYKNLANPNVIANQTPLNPSMIGLAGSDQPHNNMMPYLTLNFCIAMQGVFPPRT